MKLTESQKTQLEKPQFNAYKYIPTHQEATSFEWSVRRFIWSFKKGDTKATQFAAQVVVKMLTEKFTRLDNIVFACIPASSAVQNEARYADFCEEVCKATGMLNAYRHIKVEGEKLAVHEYRHRKSLRSTQVISFDERWFNGKQVILFDDIITRGFNFAIFSDKLESFGAEVWGGCFLGKTTFKQ